MIKFNETFRKTLIEKIEGFCTKPEKRTVDEMPSIELLLAQVFCLTQIPQYEAFFTGEFKFDKSQIQVVFRFAIEELLRRQIKSDAPLPTRD